MALYLLGRESMNDVFVRRARTISVRYLDVAIPSQTPQAAKDWVR
jgi:hypothetical protein